jgi:hypothetical protein
MDLRAAPEQLAGIGVQDEVTETQLHEALPGELGTCLEVADASLMVRAAH